MTDKNLESGVLAGSDLFPRIRFLKLTPGFLKFIQTLDIMIGGIPYTAHGAQIPPPLPYFLFLFFFLFL